MADRLRRNLAVSRYAKIRPKRRHDVAFEPREGMGFAGLEEILADMDPLNRWIYLSDLEVKATNTRAIEYICCACSVADNTLVTLDPEREDPTEPAIRNAATGVVDKLEAIWFHGIKDPLEHDSKMRYNAWIALQSVCAVRDFRTQLHLPPAHASLRERHIAVSPRPVCHYTLGMLVSAMERLVRVWPDVEIDGPLEKYVTALRMRFFSLASDAYERSLGILDFEGYVDCDTIVLEDVRMRDGTVRERTVEVLTINEAFDHYMFAVLCEMMLDIEKSKAFRHQMREINKGPKMKKGTVNNLNRWLALRMAGAENASHIVLQRFRTAFFYYYERPGNADQYIYRCVEALGQEQLEIQEQDYEAKKKQAETEFAFLYPEEFKSFSTNYFDCDPEYIVSSKVDGTFGRDSFSLFTILGFAHVFDVQMDDHWLGRFFRMAPGARDFFEPLKTNENLFVRFRGDYYVVDTLTMTATQYNDVWSAIEHWLRVYVDLAPTEVHQRYTRELREFMFEKGEFHLRPLERKHDAYSTNPLIDAEALKRIYRK